MNSIFRFGFLDIFWTIATSTEDTLLRRSYRFNDQVQVYAVQEPDLYAVLVEHAAQLSASWSLFHLVWEAPAFAPRSLSGGFLRGDDPQFSANCSYFAYRNSRD
jgi:hypothetical protein